jgi:hypothetical protein
VIHIFLNDFNITKKQRSDSNPYQNPRGFADIEKKIHLKIHMEFQGAQNGQNKFEKEQS